MLPKLVQVAPNVTRLDYGPHVSVLFSYETPLAICAPGIGWIVNRECAEASRTSAKHRTAQGLKDRPHVAPDLFADLILTALSGYANNASVSRLAVDLTQAYTDAQSRHVA